MLIPDKIRYENGVKINEKIIPWGSRWTKDDPASGFKKGDLYKSDKFLKPISYITIHNTNDLESVNDDAEQYTRATWPNQNMGSVRVHYYVDDLGAWQNLLENERGWHAADGDSGPGNSTSIAIEIIENDGKSSEDQKSEDNGARLAAYLLYKYKLVIDRLTTHNHWYPKKECPEVLLPKWDSFKNKVNTYLVALHSGANPELDNWQARYENFKKAVIKILDSN
jgi:N-acetylmuramoyl-L-alanine amidase CwlA